MNKGLIGNLAPASMQKRSIEDYSGSNLVRFPAVIEKINIDSAFVN
jgi:hypothetical protein